MFPPAHVDAVKLSLLNSPIFHGTLTPEAVRKKLSNEGEFLVEDSDDPNSLLLSVFKESVRHFVINIEQTEKGVRFRVGAMRFNSLDDLTFQLKSVESGTDSVRLGTAVYRRDNGGRFGAYSVSEDTPRTQLKTLIPLPNIKSKSILVPLKPAIMHDGIEDDLEALILLKHRHLVALLDFAFYSPHDPLILRYEYHDALSLYDHMNKETFIKTAVVLKWIQQAASLAYYLSQQKCFHSVLCAQDCYLDAGNNLKFAAAWNNTWLSWKEDTLRHPFYWRSMISSCVTMAPEERCLWSEILVTSKREHTIASMSSVAKKIFPFL
ncbi:unnamed protein product [Nippostrongylus brasiliensis]|uniref:Tyrosine-protein kinase n=1 Tax=Nippostrongylus brasiliensis TaxID=27835 RepID=A0A0N4YDL5_NIPBR|nr:unnamed protein product [Nippostrongylus brasiliensis]